MGDLSYRGARRPLDENYVLIVAVLDTKTGINQTLIVTNPDFVDYTENMEINNG
jgi:hypothetical protein